MSVESLKRVLTKIKNQAHEMRRDKYAKRLASKPDEQETPDEAGAETPEKEVEEGDDAAAIGKIKKLLSKA